MLDQSIRRKANERTQSWHQARRNGKVWASDLFRPGVYFQSCHLRTVWNWIPYQTLRASISSSVKWVSEGLSWGLRIMPVKCLARCRACPETVKDASPYCDQLSLEIQPTTLWFNFQPKRCQRISRGLENPMDGEAWWAAVHGSLRVRHDWATSLSLFIFMFWRRKWQPTPVFLAGESQGWWSLVGYHLWGGTESDTTEATAAAAGQRTLYQKNPG